jgi:hypothetical protein
MVALRKPALVTEVCRGPCFRLLPRSEFISSRTRHLLAVCRTCVRSMQKLGRRPQALGEAVCCGCGRDARCPYEHPGGMSRGFAWCAFCRRRFVGHAKCIEGVKAIRDVHAETCTRLVVPHRGLQCE